MDFDAVATTLPGELAPMLAMAATAELRGEYDEAARYYATVWRTDHSYVSAAFGLARLYTRAGDRAAAIRALDQVDPTSAHFTAAGSTAIEILLDSRGPQDLDEQTVLDAEKRADALTLESTAQRAAVRLRVLGSALDWLQAGNQSTAQRLFGAAFDERAIRTGMERAYRDLARAMTDVWERIALVEKANTIRPRTRV
jgi:serine/threonine-protein kinase PknG